MIVKIGIHIKIRKQTQTNEKKNQKTNELTINIIEIELFIKERIGKFNKLTYNEIKNFRINKLSISNDKMKYIPQQLIIIKIKLKFINQLEFKIQINIPMKPSDSILLILFLCKKCEKIN